MLLLSYSNAYRALFIKTVAASRTWTVDDDGSADYSAIQQAIDNPETLAGDTILVNSGVYHEHLVVDKSLSIIGEDQDNTIIDGDGYGRVVMITASNVAIRGFTVQNGDEGIVIPADENNVTDNVFLYNGAGVLLDTNCEGNIISWNKILYSDTLGIYGDRCGGNVIANNNVSFSSWHGIFLYASEPSIVDGNSVSSNGMDGVRIRYSSNNTITGNLVSGNDNGICIWSDEDPIRPSGLSKYNVIEDNIVVNNSCGIRVEHLGTDEEFAVNEICKNLFGYNNLGLNVSGSNGNSIYTNNFVNNSKQVFVHQSLNSTWDGGYYVGGNYWSDHNGTDLYWGSYQNETGSDGIVDFPYIVSVNPFKEDKYPFLNENEWLMVPEVSVISPSNGTYRSNTLPLVLTINKPAWISYSLDNQPNITIVEDSMLINLSIGVHNIRVYVKDALGNDVSSEVMFTVTFLGDLSLDGTVNIIDVSIVAYSFGHSVGSEKWNPDADLNNDYTINIVDITMVAIEFGNTF